MINEEEEEEKRSRRKSNQEKTIQNNYAKTFIKPVEETRILQEKKAGDCKQV